jgi:hypothetical protein
MPHSENQSGRSTGISTGISTGTGISVRFRLLWF